MIPAICPVASQELLKSMQSRELSPKSRTILAAIAKGHSYDQILAGELDLTYHDRA